MRFRIEILILLFFGSVVFSQHLLSSNFSEKPKVIRGFFKQTFGSLFNRKDEGLSEKKGSGNSISERRINSDRSTSNYEETRLNNDNSKKGFGVDESRPGSPSNCEDKFFAILNKGLNTYQQSLGKPNENKELTLEPSFANEKSIWSVSDQSFPVRANQMIAQQMISLEQFGRPGENESSSSTSSNDRSLYTTLEESVHESADEEEKKICFSGLGCFEMGKPWKSALRPVGEPVGPEVIQTTLHFYSRDNSKTQKYITLYPSIDMGGARFDPKKLTAMIVHGFSTSGDATWMKNMKDAYLKQVDANVMIVDWGKGAQHLNYFQVSGNTRVVGRQLATFVEFLKKNYGADTRKFHLIGHSLGAHVCSYLAKDVPGIARLTALDPAQPAFEGFDARVRLDKSDADFVDVIHTDAKPFLPTLGFGMMAPHGHVDFYVNGGFDQPGCVPTRKSEIPEIKNILDLAKFPVEVIAKLVGCPHARAYQILTEAFNEIEKCIFWGHKADVPNVLKSVGNTLTQGLFKTLLALSTSCSKDDCIPLHTQELFKKVFALSTTCTKEDCIPLGFATKSSPLRGSFMVTTNAKEPYCISEKGVPVGNVPSREAEFYSWHKNFHKIFEFPKRRNTG